MKHILVTGGSGYIGRYLILELLRRGHRVTALLRQPAAQLATLQRWLHTQGVPEAAVRAVYGDLGQTGLGISAQDWQSLAEVSIVYHCGALFGWQLEAATARRVNVDGAVQLLELTQQYCQLQRFVQVSGYMLTMHKHLQQLGIDGDGSQTNWPRVYARTGAYEASKLEAHFALKRRAAALAIPLTVIHPATLCGHADTGELPDNQEMARTLRLWLNGKLPAVPGGSGYRLPLVSADYLTRFMAQVIELPDTAGQDYLLADAHTPDLRTVLSWCAGAAGKPAPQWIIPVTLLQQVVKWQWLAARLQVSGEQLPFLRRETLDTQGSDAIAQRLGLVQPPLAKVLAHSTRWLLQQPAP